MNSELSCHICGSTKSVGNHHPKYPSKILYPLCQRCHFIVGYYAEMMLCNVGYNNTSKCYTRGKDYDNFVQRFKITPEECKEIRDKYFYIVQMDAPK